MLADVFPAVQLALDDCGVGKARAAPDGLERLQRVDGDVGVYGVGTGNSDFLHGNTSLTIIVLVRPALANAFMSIKITVAVARGLFWDLICLEYYGIMVLFQGGTRCLEITVL